MFRARHALALGTVAVSFAVAGCNTPEAVSKFCTASSTTLGAAVPVFQDLDATCLRRKNLEKRIGSFSSVQDDPGCTAIAAQADAAVATTEVLADYFTAINSIATFGTAKTGTDALALVARTGAAVSNDTAAQNALSSIARFLVSGATAGYQQHSLNKDLTAVSDNIGHVTDALDKIVGIYVTQLNLEDTRLAEHYRDFSDHNAGGQVTLELDDRWHADEHALNAKKAAAGNLLFALNTIKKGSADLAGNARTLKAKELPGLLDPYITQLQTLIPQIQKAF